MEDKSIFELIAEYSAGTISPADAELLRERLESDAEAMRLFREIRETEKVLKSVQVQEKIDLQKSWQRLDSSLAGLPRKGRRLFLTVGSVVAASCLLPHPATTEATMVSASTRLTAFLFIVILPPK